MSTTLCERCFPSFGQHEILTIVPMGPCVECGSMDKSYGGDVTCHLFRGDPRTIATGRGAASNTTTRPVPSQLSPEEPAAPTPGNNALDRIVGEFLTRMLLHGFDVKSVRVETVSGHVADFGVFVFDAKDGGAG